MSFHLTDNEWCILEALWDAGPLTLGPLLERLSPVTGWSRTTLHTYLTRMASKDLITMDESTPRRYAAALSRNACADSQRRELVDRVYRGSAGQLVTAFVKDGSLTEAERAELRRLLDEMEV